MYGKEYNIFLLHNCQFLIPPQCTLRRDFIVTKILVYLPNQTTHSCRKLAISKQGFVIARKRYSHTFRNGSKSEPLLKELPMEVDGILYQSVNENKSELLEAIIDYYV